MKQIQTIEWSLVSALVGLFLFFGLSDIGKQTLVDEPLWAFDRVESYWQNIKDSDWKNVRPSDKPGVTVALLASYGFTVHVRPSEIKETISWQMREELLKKMRIPLVLFLALLIPLYYYLIRRLLGTEVALSALLMTILSPALLGMSRILNPDTLLWLLIPLTILSYCVLLKRPEKKMLILTGVLFGLCILTKYVANILFVYLPFISVLYVLYRAKTLTETRTILRTHIKQFASVSLLAIAVYCILLPSVWVEPSHILKGTILSQAFEPIWKPYVALMIILIIDIMCLPKSFTAVTIVKIQSIRKYVLPSISALWLSIIGCVIATAHMHIPFDYQTSLQSPKSSGRDLGFTTTLLTDFYVFIFSISAVILAGLIIFFSQSIYKKNNNDASKNLWLICALALFPALYYAGSAITGVTTILRYQVALIPLMILLSSIGLQTLIKNYSKKTKSVFYGIIAIILITQVLWVKPYYFSFSNIFLPKTDVLNIKDMGDGSYQAAQYLNALPNAKNMKIWADKNGICASFAGQCETSVSVAKFEEYGHTSFDYYVITRGRKHLTLRNAKRMRKKEGAPERTFHFDKLYENTVPVEHEILPGNKKANYIRIINSKDYNIIAPNNQKTP